jgi:hypothetical protein
MMTVPSAADLRAALARERVLLYRVATRAGMHPARASRLLHEHEPLPDHVARVLAAAIEEEAALRRRRSAR